MNHDDPKHRSPPRAEPLQPDRPTRGTDKQPPDGSEAQQGNSAEHARELKQQSEDAIANTREGYGGR